MRIGILTLPLHTNYGGILQAYALQTILERMGHEVWVIHKNPRLKEPEFWEYIRRYCQKIFLGKRIFIKGEKWSNKVSPILSKKTGIFIKNHIQCHTIESFSQLEENDFNAIIVGSDQVWRKEYFVEAWREKETNAFLGFTENWDIQRLVYAASFGTNEWGFSEKYSVDISRLIKKFNAVSVREKNGVEICKKYLNVEALHLLDPTMLLDSNDYMELINDYDLSSQSDNLFCYILDDSKEKQNIINMVSATRDLTPSQMYFPTEYSDATQCWPVPPVEQFIKGIMNAKFVVTDSFHGCVFSIIFGRPFIAIVNKKRGAARMESLLQMFNLEDHLICDVLEYQSKGSYEISDHVRNALESYRKESVEFLKRNLKS